MKTYYVYILASRRNGTLYVGVTDDLIYRTYQHKQGLVDGFSKSYGVKTLVYFEASDSVVSAIAREKQLKKWNRAWKIKLIEAHNPGWRDLYLSLIPGSPIRSVASATSD